MRRIETVDGLFAPGDPAANLKGSPVRNWWLNAIQEELAGVVEGLGGTLDPEDNGQLFDWLIASLAMKVGDATQIFRVAGAVGANDATPLAQVQSLLLGYGQSYQDFTAGGRTSGTTYYNTTGRSIFVSVSLQSTVASIMQLFVGGAMIANTYIVAGQAGALTAIIPPGSSYSSTCNTGTISVSRWFELR